MKTGIDLKEELKILLIDFIKRSTSRETLALIVSIILLATNILTWQEVVSFLGATGVLINTNKIVKSKVVGGE